jgi:diguanylate cyclase (GGDEF)-like protein
MLAAEDAERRARRDALTGLGNRLAFQEAIAREVANAKRRQRPLSVLLGDLENFKAINDAFGHLRGDQCLREVGEAISGQARAGDECFRWGGDEFAVLLPDTSPEQAIHARDRLVSRVNAQCMTPDDRPLKMGCVVTALEPGQGAEELLMEADRALTALKSGGGARRG